MKKLALAFTAILVVSASCSDGGTPDQVVKRLFNALKNSDGDTVAASMSEEALEGIYQNLEEMKENPEECVAFHTNVWDALGH